MHLSIVTAVWNRADTVADAVQGLRTQDWTDWEQVVQDGGSPDGTLQVLDGLLGHRAYLESGVDAGLYDAVNRGPARTTCEVVGLLHSDDLYAAPDILSSVAAVLKNPGIDAVYGDLLYVARTDTLRVARTLRSQPFSPALLRRGWMPPTCLRQTAEVGDIRPRCPDANA